MSDRVTIDGLLRDANAYAAACEMTGNRGAKVYEICRGIVELLGASQPCGHDDAEVTMYRGEPRVTVPIGADRFMFDVDTLRQLCVGWLRACDAADAKRGGEAG